MKLITLSPHTRPGRLGFTHAVELRIVWISSDDYHKRTKSLYRFSALIQQQMGRPYQKTWSRPQPRRRWYIYGIDQDRTVRLCFKNPRDQLLASMLYQ